MDGVVPPGTTTNDGCDQGRHRGRPPPPPSRGAGPLVSPPPPLERLPLPSPPAMRPPPPLSPPPRMIVVLSPPPLEPAASPCLPWRRGRPRPSPTAAACCRFAASSTRTAASSLSPGIAAAPPLVVADYRIAAFSAQLFPPLLGVAANSPLPPSFAADCRLCSSSGTG
jgi:hypothetical protein